MLLSGDKLPIMFICEENLSDDFPPGYDSEEMTSGEFYACPVGVVLWEEYRARHPNAQAEPPGLPESLPGAVEYWEHSNACDDCNEV
jgi:hypothetical protein